MVSYKRKGGLRFVRVGNYHLTLCRSSMGRATRANGQAIANMLMGGSLVGIGYSIAAMVAPLLA
jgi:hypothetical protein